MKLWNYWTISEKAPTLYFFKRVFKRKTEEDRNRFALYLPRTQGMYAIFIIFCHSFTIGWVVWSSDVFVYVSICDAYLPGFKILPSVQFFARMWHVAILVTSGLCRTIYWPPSAASTIYLLPPLLFSSLAITRYLFLSFVPFSFYLSFPLAFSLFCPLHSFFVPFLLFPSLTLFFYLDHRLRSSWINVRTLPLLYLNFDISNFLPRYFAISTVIGLQTHGLLNNLKRNIL